MREEMRRDLTIALKQRDQLAMSVLRSALAAIDNAEAQGTETSTAIGSASPYVAGGVVGLGAAEVERRQLTERDIEAIIRHEINERVTAATQYAAAGHADIAERMSAEAVLLRRYLRQ